MQFFCGLAAVLLAVAAVLFFPVFLTYLESGQVPRFPTLIAAGFIALAALISFFSGMILDTIAKKSRQEFEAGLTYYELKFKELMKEMD